MKKVIVTRRWPKAVEDELKAHYDVELNEADIPFDTARMQYALQNADAVLPTVTDKLDADVFKIDNIQASVIANYGVGFAHIDTDAAKAHNITVTNTPDVLSDCTADVAMTLMLMVARRAGEGERELRSGNWTGWRPTHMVGSKVTGKTLGIVGFGRIGQAMAMRAHHGFGMPILVQNRSMVAPKVLAACNAVQVENLDELMRQSDFVSFHCPGGDANANLVNAKNLALMKPSAFLINTARGEIIDEAALFDALSSKQIAGAGLDVFRGEPALDPRFMEMPNAVMLPHLGSATVETREAMGFRVLENMEAFFAGNTPGDKVA